MSAAVASPLVRNVLGVLAASALAMLAACGSSDRVAAPQFVISDGAHSSGNPNFFFLPPLSANPVSQPGYDPEGFDPTADPTVDICLLDGSDCAASQPVGFPLTYTMSSGAGSETIRLGDGYYLVNWHTRDSHLDTSRFYRIRVFVAHTLLGFADVDPVDSGRDLRSVNTGLYVGVVNNTTLPIKFRIERGALAIIDIREVIAVRDATGVPQPIDLAIRESIGVSDAVAALPPVAIDVQEVLGVADRAGVLPPVALGVRETITVSDAPRTVPPIALDVRETVRVTDQPRALPPVAVNVGEVLGVADQSRVLPPIALRVSEAVTLADQPRVLPPVAVTIQETVGLAERRAVLPPVAISVTETIRVTDAAEVTLP